MEGKKTLFFWQGNKLIAETDNQQHWQSYVYEPDSFRPLATVVGNKRTAEKTRTYWYQNDHLGTPHSLTDNMGNVVWAATYSAYGKQLTQWQDEKRPKVDNPLRFQGQYADKETGLHYNLNRYYDPQVGRYLTQDLIGLSGSLNTYAYVDNNPIGWVDQLGLFRTEATGFENNSVNSSIEIPQPPVARGGAKVENISPNDATRIQNAANRTRQEITVVGSRANGSASPVSDWDYVMSGNGRQRHSAKSSVPRGVAGGEENSLGRETGIDIFTESVELSKPHITFFPRLLLGAKK